MSGVAQLHARRNEPPWMDEFPLAARRLATWLPTAWPAAIVRESGRALSKAHPTAAEELAR
jgi:hypothetical protein